MNINFATEQGLQYLINIAFFVVLFLLPGLLKLGKDSVVAERRAEGKADGGEKKGD